jgi:polyisoprenoid-binding protein YceI
MSFKSFSRSIALGTALALAVGAPAQAAEYQQATGSRLTFASKYQGEVFVGTFPDFRTRLSFDPAEPAAGKLDVLIPLAAVSTDNTDRDSTLVGADFFSAATFAQARFTANGFRSLGDNQYAADGALSLRGVSRPVTLTFTWTDGAKPVLVGKATVKRLDFNVGGGDWADLEIIPNEVAVATRVVFEPAR